MPPQGGATINSGLMTAFNTPIGKYLRLGQNGESEGLTRIVGKGGLYSRMSLIYKYETLHGFKNGVSGGCYVLIIKWCYPQSTLWVWQIFRRSILFFSSKFQISARLSLLLALLIYFFAADVVVSGPAFPLKRDATEEVIEEEQVPRTQVQTPAMIRYPA